MTTEGLLCQEVKRVSAKLIRCGLKHVHCYEYLKQNPQVFAKEAKEDYDLVSDAELQLKTPVAPEMNAPPITTSQGQQKTGEPQ